MRLNIQPEWIDLYGHMTAAQYYAVLEECGFKLYDRYGIGAAYTRAHGNGLFAVESHTNFHRELKAGEAVEVTLRILGFDTKRVLTLCELINAGNGLLSASLEQLSVHVSLDSRKVVQFSQATLTALQRGKDADDQRPMSLEPVSRLRLGPRQPNKESPIRRG